MDYISDISFVDTKELKISFRNLDSAVVDIIVSDQKVTFAIADFIDILKLLSEITDRS